MRTRFSIFLFAPLILLSVSTFSPLGTSNYPPPSGVQHYFYNFTDGTMYVYDIDNRFNLVYSTTQATTSGIRGMVASPTDGMLYIAYGGAGGGTGNGGLLKYNLLANSVVWQKAYNFGIDSPGITPDGKTVYLADGEFSGSNLWYVIDTSTGNIITSIAAGTGPHNTIVSLNGKHVYMGARYTPSDYIADTSTNKVIGTIGPLISGGRPFTINGTETYAFTTQENYLGFQVSNITSGHVMYTVPVTGFTNNNSMLIPDHGISLSPDEREIYLIDGENDYVHVFDVTGLPNAAPKQVADIKLTKLIAGQTESSCAYDCGKEGWMLHSTSGRYVFVGDTGDVIDTTTRTVVANIPTLQNSRKYLEIDWQTGHPSFTTNRYGLGYVTGGTVTPTPTPTATPAPIPTPSPTPTPAPGGVIAQDSFQRANQTFWGTASDGQNWTSDASTNAVFSITNNTGKITNAGSTSLNAIVGPMSTDEDVLFSGSLSAFSSSNIGSVIRWADTNDWYKAYIDGTNLVIQKKVNGATTTLKTTPFTATTNTNYCLRVQVVGTTLNARVWATGQAEPANWMATATDATFASGRVGLRMLTQGGTATYTSFTATSLAPTPTPTPTANPTPTATPTPTNTPTPTPTSTPTPTPTNTPAPTPVSSIIAQDTFQRGNQTFWGTASDGHVWGADAATNAIFTIGSNAGRVSGGTTSYTGILGSTTMNGQILFSGSLSNVTSNNLGGVLRFNDGNNWYKAYVDGTSLVVQKRVNGTATILTSVSFAATAGTNYSIRFRVVGTTLSAKVWATASGEPAGWMATVTDSSFASGYCGLRMQTLNATATYTSFIATSL
jgi:YVTN family beta-propeller protein